MQTTADYMNQTKRIFLVPLFFFLVVVIFYVYWIISAIYIWSVGTVKSKSLTPFASVSWNTNTRYVFLYDLFGLFWVNAFMIGCCQFILAVAAATWYFSHSADSGGSAMIMKGFKWTIRYHLGSIAFGSLVIAICEFIKFMFEYYRKKMTGRIFQNPIGKCLLWTTSYCLSCLNRVVKFISKMAYIQIALTSSNFCMSAWKAFILILGNAGRFAVATVLGAIFIFVGKVLIVCSTIIVCYIIITQTSSINSKISGPYFPCILFGLISYCVAAVFLSIFGFSMDVILQSFLVDETLAGEGSYGAHRPRTLDAFAKQPPSRGKKRCCCC
jgi:Plasma-membrane choline transporter